MVSTFTKLVSQHWEYNAERSFSFSASVYNYKSTNSVTIGQGLLLWYKYIKRSIRILTSTNIPKKTVQKNLTVD